MKNELVRKKNGWLVERKAFAQLQHLDWSIQDPFIVTADGWIHDCDAYGEDEESTNYLALNVNIKYSTH
jgi:hypothetical protein